MNALQLMIVLLTGTITLNAVVKIADDFASLREYLAEDSPDGLIDLLQEKRQWIERHLFCAITGLGLVAFLKHSPSLDKFDMLAGLAAVHVSLSLILALVESLFAQRISMAISSRMEPVKIKAREQERM